MLLGGATADHNAVLMVQSDYGGAASAQECSCCARLWLNALQVCKGMRVPCCTHRTQQTVCTRNRTRRGCGTQDPASPAPLQLVDILNVIQRQDGLLHALLRRTESLAGRVTLVRLSLHPAKCPRLQHTPLIPLLQLAKKLHHQDGNQAVLEEFCLACSRKRAKGKCSMQFE